ncbi:MAG: hypothetical protein LV477_01255 [Candidatus Nitrosotalea sp.]|nr:hypothetical protein [Candidatus Nitrosotalea sp.]
MRSIFAATLVGVVSIVLLLPVANALTPRSDFGDNVSTYRLFGSKVCGDHLCKPGEWNTWITNLISSQIKKFNTMIGIKNPQPNTVKNAAYDTSNLLDTSSGDITRISTFSMGDGQYTSFVSVTNNGPLGVNHIVISQTNPDVKTLKAWISPQWDSSIALYKTSFDTSKSSLTQDQTLNIVIVTDGKPAFSLDSLEAK